MLRPFSRFCVTIGAIPESIINSLSYEQQLLRLIKFLKQTVIPAIDGNTTAIKEIEEAMNELKSYVDDYFENLDIQDEIDNKLDEMFENGQLEEDIGKYFQNEWELLQPYLGEELGTCVVIRNNNFTMMYDTGYTGEDDILTNFLTLNNITHLDALIISHFHADHCGCQETILSNYCDENTKIYIGMIPDYDQFTADEAGSKLRYEQFVEICENLELTYSVPDNNSKETINGVTLRFLNTDINYLNGYYSAMSDSNLSNYEKSTANNVSLVCEVNINGSKILLSGDIEQPAQTNIKDYINKVDLLMIPHHNWNSYGDKAYFDRADPTLAFANRGTSEANFFPYFSRYKRFEKDIRLIQNLEVPIKIKSNYGKMVVESGVDMVTAFEDSTKTQLLTFLPSCEHCLFSEVDLYDFTKWDSEYIFDLLMNYSDREGFSTSFYRQSRYTALVDQLTTYLDPTTTNLEYSITVTTKYIDFVLGSYAFQTYRIYREYINPAQKYATLIDNAYANIELTGSDIKNDNVRNRESFIAYVSDSATENVYSVPVYRVNTSINNSQYIGYWQNLSSNRFLTLMKVEINFSGSTYTLSYYRMVFDKQENTWTINNTSPTLSKIKI